MSAGAGERAHAAGESADERLTHWEGEPVRVLESAWGVPHLEAWRSVGSTNDRVRELAAEGASPFAVVTADEQTRGRGRVGRRWESPMGAGLWMSVLLRPPAEDAARLTPLLVGLAVCRAVERVLTGLSASLKWPNDVLLGDRKVAGVLCEALPGRGVVAGLGVNVRQRLSDFPPELRSRAVSLGMAYGSPVSRIALAGEVVRAMQELLSRPPLRLDDRLLDELRARDALLGKEIRIGDDVQGVARGVDAAGRLLVEEGGSLRAVAAGSVTIVSGSGAGAAPRS